LGSSAREDPSTKYKERFLQYIVCVLSLELHYKCHEELNVYPLQRRSEKHTDNMKLKHIGEKIEKKYH
jgi:hypothetical protein